ncbi:serine/threonine-protein kinase ULK3 [Hyalella azteca]|uniref:Serine/threonine-protein kinase ULK3 n=1 Tax=Hyalella azteca TaxID=294128 RepID=A0A8B7N0B1_HYAAZ|nr:serine/threonine-protein kinase ULK3 [Hyalella azteca]
MAPTEGLPPVRLADYVVCEKIGSGGYADVYRAYRKPPATKEFVAIKAVLRSNLSSSATDSLITEIRLLKSLKHDHIVQLIDFLCDENYVYILMEYCGGGDLSHFIKSRHRLPEIACQRFLQQLASALEYMREQKVSHFDLKPQNILLTSRKNPVVKIADFGLAQHLSESEIVSKIKGSPLYMAPEILLHKKYDAKVDLWSVGVILYECLFGKAPYSSASMEELIQRIKSDVPIKIPSQACISRECEDLLMRCLERDPQKRIDFEDFFQHSFVDLEHRPKADSCEKARSLVVKAVEHDQKHEYKEALDLYVESLRYLVPAIHIETDASRKLAMRKSAKQYLDRTDQLKKLLSDSGPPTVDAPTVGGPTLASIFVHNEARNFSTDFLPNTISAGEWIIHQQNVLELSALAATTATMLGAIDIAKSAELYEQEGSNSIAIEKYELALGKLLSLSQNEPHGRRRELLLEVIQHWLKRAELIKDVLDAAKVRTNGAAATIQAKDLTLISDSSKKKSPLRGKLTKLIARKESAAASKSKEPSSPPASIGPQATGQLLLESDYEKSCAIQ